tara:strand:+ start:650 stop:886 length:237 start_codon:yes stop_codon:yes gene_type:complete
MTTSAYDDFEQKLRSVSLDHLMTLGANISTTYALAGGHNKAHMNEVRLSYVDDELARRGVESPDWYELEGEFNGPGST